MRVLGVVPVLAGVLFAADGVQKLLGAAMSPPAALAFFGWTGGLLEVAFGLLLARGSRGMRPASGGVRSHRQLA